MRRVKDHSGNAQTARGVLAYAGHSGGYGVHMARRTPWHPGEPRPEVLDRAALRVHQLQGEPGLPHVGEGPAAAVDLVAAYAELVAVAMARARFLGALLADQYADARAADDAGGRQPRDESPDGPPGISGLVGYTYQAAVVGVGEAATYERAPTGEEIRGLVRLEAEERDRAARLIRDALRIGVDLQRTEMMLGYARTASAAMRALIGELGLDVHSEPVLRAAGRAGLTARRALGHDDGDPDVHAGPALSPAERARVLDDALARTRL